MGSPCAQELPIGVDFECFIFRSTYRGCPFFCLQKRNRKSKNQNTLRGNCSFVSVYYDSANVGVSFSSAMLWGKLFLRLGGIYFFWWVGCLVIGTLRVWYSFSPLRFWGLEGFSPAAVFLFFATNKLRLRGVFACGGFSFSPQRH